MGNNPTFQCKFAETTYYARESQVTAPRSEEQEESVRSVSVAAAVGGAVHFQSAQEEDGVTSPDESLLRGRLKNSETLHVRVGQWYGRTLVV